MHVARCGTINAMPVYATPDLPERLLTVVEIFGANAVRLALLEALHALGRAATTTQLHAHVLGHAAEHSPGNLGIATIHRHLSALEKAGVVTRSGQGGRGNPPHLWTLNTRALLAGIDDLRRHFS